MNKLMSLLLVLVAALGTTEAFATSYYDRIRSMFDFGGTNISLHEIEGWIAGRCYELATPHNAVAALLGRHSTGGFDGPIAISAEKISVLLAYHQPATVFDLIYPDWVPQIDGDLRNAALALSFPYPLDNSLGVSVFALNERMLTYRFRRYGDYIVQTVRCERWGGCQSLDTFIDYPKGTIVNTCYYFKKVR